MDKVKGKEELNEQDRRVDTKAQTQRISKEELKREEKLNDQDIRVYAKQRK